MAHNLQEKILGKIIDQFSKRAVAVEFLTDLLGVGKDAVYRRLRGETMLSPVEIANLAKEFNLSVDELIYEGEQKTVVGINNLLEEPYSFDSILKNYVVSLEKFIVPKSKLICVWNQLPLLALVNFPLLVKFKLEVSKGFEASNANLNVDGIFTASTCNSIQKWLNKMERILERTHRKEFWSPFILDPILNDLEVANQLDLFSSQQEIKAVIQQLEGLVDCYEKKVLKSEEQIINQEGNINNVPFLLFLVTRGVFTNMLFVASQASRKRTILFPDLPIQIYNQDEPLVSTYENYLSKLVEFEVPLLGKRATLFFSELRQKINGTKQKLKV